MGTTIWFFAGGTYDMIDVYRTLRTVKRDQLDAGMVVGHHNLGDEAEDEKAVEAAAGYG